MSERTHDPVKPPRVTEAWYVACTSEELRAEPLSRSIYGTPIVVFRGAEGRVGAVLDRCPHRNVPLSLGRVRDCALECAYHGWRFDTAGECVAVPGLIGEPAASARRVESFPVVEQQGFVWVYATADGRPEAPPFRFAYADDPRYTIVRREVRARGSVHMVAENALDVPHTAFVHGGLFRNDTRRQEITAVVKRWADRVECEYIGEQRPNGLVGWLLSPTGGVVTHFDRFYLPSIVEVEYALGTESHVVVNAACTPVDDYDTRLYAVVALRTRVPIGLIRPIVEPFALRIFGQDKAILAVQSDTVHRFDDLAYASTELDTVGPHILKLLRRAERGELGDRDAAPWTREIRLRV